MVLLTIAGVPVDFPYEPYACQVKYMEKVMRTLQNEWNCALESPTGTGKTLCLLCACLAWQENQKSVLRPITDTKDALGKGSSDLTGGAVAARPTGFLLVPKIIYTSRTHSQLSQVIRELNKTTYKKKIKVCLMGSREQTCINQEVVAEENAMLKNNLCRVKVAQQSCEFYRNFSDMKYPQAAFVKDNVLDIEDVVRIGKQFKVCPFYKVRDNLETADLVLVPYNYVLDRSVRKANKIDLKNSVLIFDEAHNLQKICEESASCSFGTKDLALCLKEAQFVLDKINADTELYRSLMDESAAEFGKANLDATVNQPETSINLKELAHAIVLLHNLEKEFVALDLNSARATNNLIPGVVMPSKFLFDLLDRAQLYPNLKEPLCGLIDQVVTYLALREGNSIWQSRGQGLQKLATFLSTIFAKDAAVINCGRDDAKDASRHFKVYICEEDTGTKDASTNLWTRNNGKTGGTRNLVLHYWCFCAGPGMRNLQEGGVRSIILTSGTLAPLPSFIAEMGITFHAQLENTHVISAEQIWAGVVSHGSDKQLFTSTFVNRENAAYLNSLGNSIINMIRVIPQGVLIFFASYAHLNSCVNHWKETKHFDRINQLKPVFIEPKNKRELPLRIDDFQGKVNDPSGNGAIFMAVCRGKVSEGIDFADTSARAVLIAGVPYPPKFDPRVVLKQQYLSELCTNKGAPQQQGMSSLQWYELEAARAVNQAMGRVIRHKDDFGAVILLDCRFADWKREKFPNWIRSFMVNRAEFGPVMSSLSSFYKGRGIASKLKSIGPTNEKTVVHTTPQPVLITKATCQDRKEIFVTPSVANNNLNMNDLVPEVTSVPVSLERKISRPVKPQYSTFLEEIEAETSTEPMLRRTTDDIRDQQLPSCSSNIAATSATSSEASTSDKAPAKKRIKLKNDGPADDQWMKCGPVEYVLRLKRELNENEYQGVFSILSNYKQKQNLALLLREAASLFLPRHAAAFKGLKNYIRHDHIQEFDNYCSKFLSN